MDNKKRLGDRLVEAGVITSAQLSLALAEQKRHGGFLGETLELLGFASQKKISEFLAQESKAKFVDPTKIEIEQELLKLVPSDFAEKNKCIPINKEGDILTVAIVDTFDIPTIDKLELMTGLRIDVVASTEKMILEAIEIHYSHAETVEELIDKSLQAIDMNEDIEEVGLQAPLVRLVDRLIVAAIRRNATDLHIEPQENSVVIRMRVDGYLYQETLLPIAILPGVNARIKILAGLDVTEHRLPQDGRLTTVAAGKRIDLRVSSLPTNWGESMVLRILDNDNAVVELEKLGLDGRDLHNVNSAINSPFGIILVTGPTGSGKTTTLYASLHKMDKETQSVFTLEDPIEYSIPLVRQVQVKPEVGLTFANGLRALLRQDPDVMLVGEIRDEETAQLATRASLTGHLVLSTLHTNSAIGAIPRLINMGIEPYILSSALKLVVAQRLVRRICPYCKVVDEDAHKQLQSFNHDPHTNTTFFKGQGCPECFNTGYKGRIAIYETLPITEKLRDIIRPSVQESDLLEIAIEDGFRMMVHDGIEKAKNGVVSIKDVLRVTG